MRLPQARRGHRYADDAPRRAGARAGRALRRAGVVGRRDVFRAPPEVRLLLKTTRPSRWRRESKALLKCNEPPPVRALVAEVVREKTGERLVLAGVEEEALEDHTTRSPGPAAEECFRAGLLEERLRRRVKSQGALRVVPVDCSISTQACTYGLLGHVALLARLDRVHRV